MTSKSNPSEIEKISNNFTNKIVHEFFIDRNEITGDQILNLTEFKQLNLFIIKELFKKWNEEQAKIKSPFFNYDADEVKKSLEDLMNVLSRNILIKKEEFAQLLKIATIDTINLYQDPKEYFSVMFRLLPDFKVDEKWLNLNGKFYKDYGWVLRELMTKTNGEFLYVNDAVSIVNEAINGVNAEDHSIDLAEIWKIAGETSPQPEAPKTENSVSNQSFFDSIESYKQAKQAEIKHTEIENSPAAAPIVQMEQKVATIQSQANLQTNSVSLNEAMEEKDQSNSVSDSYQNSRIDSIKGNISLNQKYLFINNLFDGEANLFDKVISEIEVCTSLQQAKDTVLKTYIDRYKWNLESPEAEEFIDVLKRRFGN